MFPLLPSWDPLPAGPVAPLLSIGFPLVLVALLALLALFACAGILAVDLARKRAQQPKIRTAEPSAKRSEAVIEIGHPTVPHAAAGGRR